MEEKITPVSRHKHFTFYNGGNNPLSEILAPTTPFELGEVRVHIDD